MTAGWSLAEAFVEVAPVDAARVLDAARADEVAEVLDRVAPRAGARTLLRMDPVRAAAALARAEGETAGRLLTELPLGAAALLLRAMPEEDRARVMRGLGEETRRTLLAALTQPPGTAGALMDADVYAVPEDALVEDARRRAADRMRPPGNYLYLVDEQRKLTGVLNTGLLAVIDPGAPLSASSKPATARVPVQADSDAILAHPGWRELHALPVVDGDGRLVGVLRREVVEQLREHREHQAGAPGDVSLALAELAWAWTAAAVDEMAQVIRPVPGPGTPPAGEPGGES